MSSLIISCSLNPNSRSFLLAQAAQAALTAPAKPAEATAGGTSAVRLIDLRDVPLPLCDGTAEQTDADNAQGCGPQVRMLTEAITQASAVLLAVPIYNFNTSAAAKNLIELTGAAWRHKIVGFLCAAGGNSSYMAPMALVHSLMLDYRCLIVPCFVYAARTDFSDDTIATDAVRNRVAALCRAAVRLADALADGHWARDPDS